MRLTQLVSWSCVTLNLVAGRESCIHGTIFLHLFLVLSSLTTHLGDGGGGRGKTKGWFLLHTSSTTFLFLLSVGGNKSSYLHKTPMTHRTGSWSKSDSCSMSVMYFTIINVMCDFIVCNAHVSLQ